MRVLRYGETTTWTFRGYNLPADDEVQTAFLTIKDTWAEEDQEQGPEPPRLQLAVTPPSSSDGAFSQDDEGNWLAVFDLSVEQTTTELGPPPRCLWYEVTLVGADFLHRPFVGQIRMLPDVYTQVES